MTRRLSKQKVERLRKAAAQKLGQRPRLVAPDPPPRYDDVFLAGMKQLDTAFIQGEVIEVNGLLYGYMPPTES